MADVAAPEKLSTRQLNAIVALLNQPSVRSAAETVGCPERTLYSWLKQPAFAAAYREGRREATGQAIARLQQASSAAVAVLLRVMASDTTPVVARISAARTVLEFAVKAVELEDVQERLELLERRYAEKL